MGAGYIPILGTMVDIAFKANLANLAILEAHLRRTPRYVRPNMSLSISQTPFLSLGMLILTYPHRGLGCSLGLVKEPQIGNRKVVRQIRLEYAQLDTTEREFHTYLANLVVANKCFPSKWSAQVHCLTYAIGSAKIPKANEEENSEKEVGLTA